MAKSRSTVEVIPSARRLITSLRDIGYDFIHAVADIIDNSIAAKASRVEIDMRFDGDQSWLRIADNGTGMSGTMITEAMRFGTERDYAPNELGRFGLGLKTASLSQCTRLSVASRTDRKSRRIEVRQWDLEHVEATNRWEVINLPAGDRTDALVGPLQERPGTVVLWEVLDRVLDYKIPWGDRAKNGFYKMAEHLDQHLGMVFHRFLSGQAHRRKKLTITINGSRVEAWDPFARDEPKTIDYKEEQFETHGSNGPGLVGYHAYILPPQEAFSSLQAFQRYSGPRKWNAQQGFYVYRSDRVIQSGGWSYMRTSDEHTKLARVALDFRPDLDSVFDLNVSKARVNLPADLRALLKPHIDELTKYSRTVYSGPPKRNSGGHVGTNRSCGGGESVSQCGGWNTTSNTDGPSHAKGTDDRVTTPPPFESNPPHVNSMCSRIGKAIEGAAEAVGEKSALRRMKKALRNIDEEAAHALGW